MEVELLELVEKTKANTNHVLALYRAGHATRDELLVAFTELVFVSGVLLDDPMETFEYRVKIATLATDKEDHHRHTTEADVIMEYAAEAVYNY